MHCWRLRTWRLMVIFTLPIVSDYERTKRPPTVLGGRHYQDHTVSIKQPRGSFASNNATSCISFYPRWMPSSYCSARYHKQGDILHECSNSFVTRKCNTDRGKYFERSVHPILFSHYSIDMVAVELLILCNVLDALLQLLASNHPAVIKTALVALATMSMHSTCETATLK